MNSTSSSNNIKTLTRQNGGNENKILQSFLSFLILGYFGIKIVYGGFFGLYPDKYYYRSVDIQTNEGGDMTNTKNISLNSFMPGIWNNEITDFVSFIILSGIVYVFTDVSSRKMFQAGGMVSPPLVIGYIIGLTFPIFYKNIKVDCRLDKLSCEQQNYVTLGFLFLIILVLFGVNSRNQSENKSSYFIYITAVILVIIGLYFTRKLSKTYLQTTYYQNQDDKCTYKQSGYLFTSGDQLLITPAFAAWVALMFFAIEPQSEGVRTFIYFMYGFLFGIFTSSMSYYGIDYFLIKLGEKSCNSVDECYLKDMPRPPADTKASDGSVTTDEISGEEYIVDDTAGILSKNMQTVKTLLLTFIILMFIYFLYIGYKSQKK